MDKSELERKLECAEFYAKSLEYKIETLEPKSAAYDRLMSGGKKTLKEWANIFGCPIAMDSDGWAYLYEKVPVVEYGDWCNPSGKTVFFGKVSPSYIDFSGDWTTSLTLPDGWEDV